MTLDFILKKFTNETLRIFLSKCNDEVYRTARKKEQLITQLLTYPPESILDFFTVLELKEALEELSLSKTGTQIL